MATKKKPVKKEEITTPVEDIKEKADELIGKSIEKDMVIPATEAPEEDKIEEPKKKSQKIQVAKPKFEVGSIVYVSKEVEADLNGFNLSISQYKKETYTVEAYDENTGVYTLRHLKLLLKLKEADLVAPSERAHDVLNRKQF